MKLELVSYAAVPKITEETLEEYKSVHGMWQPLVLRYRLKGPLPFFFE